MKRKIILGIAFCIFVLITIAAAFVVHDVDVVKKDNFARSYMPHIAWAVVEKYREDNNVYPKSIEELTAKSDGDVKKLLKEDLQIWFKMGLKLDYELRTNGFSMTVPGIDSWRREQNTLRKEYKIGEALK